MRSSSSSSSAAGRGIPEAEKALAPSGGRRAKEEEEAKEAAAALDDVVVVKRRRVVVVGACCNIEAPCCSIERLLCPSNFMDAMRRARPAILQRRVSKGRFLGREWTCPVEAMCSVFFCKHRRRREKKSKKSKVKSSSFFFVFLLFFSLFFSLFLDTSFEKKTTAWTLSVPPLALQRHALVVTASSPGASEPRAACFWGRALTDGGKVDDDIRRQHRQQRLLLRPLQPKTKRLLALFLLPLLREDSGHGPGKRQSKVRRGKKILDSENVHWHPSEN